MRRRSIVKTASLVLVLAAAAGAALAQTRTVPTERIIPPPEEPESQPPEHRPDTPPVTEGGEPPPCVTDETSYRMDGNRPTFRIEVRNACEKRYRCVVSAYVVGAKGPASGEGTLVLGPKSAGAAAIQTYVMTVKAIGGMANVSRTCKEI